MREILFRGKSVNSGEWVEGSLVITTIEPADDTPIKHYHIEDMTIGVFPNEFQSGLSETVDPETVGQFTGLTDKNGKKIFEGDIVKAERICNRNSWTGCVAWWNGCFAIQGLKDGNNVPAIDLFKDYEVIGNIHDNPELMEG